MATPLTCAASTDCDVGDHDPMEGGEDDPQQPDENQARLIVALNGRVLRFPQARTRLQGMITDPMNGALYDDNGNAFVRKAQAEVIIHASGRPTRISREHAVALHRLFLIRETGAFRAIMQHNQPQE